MNALLFGFSYPDFCCVYCVMLLESCMGDGELEVLEGEAQDVVQPLLAITRKSRSHTDVHSAKSRRVRYLDVVHRHTISNIVIQ